MADEDILWLIGMMGSGKTSVGTRLAQRLGLPFRDTDEEIEHHAGIPIGDLWERRGEDAFRDIEQEQIRVFAESNGVIATGGGAVLRDENVTRMRESGLVVWLRAAPTVLAERVGAGSSRPLLAGNPTEPALESLLDTRWDRYQLAAHHLVDTDDLDIDEVVDRVEALWTGS